MRDLLGFEARGDTPKLTQSKLTRLNVTKPRRRGVALILMAVSFVAISGMVGLAVDMGILYFLKARLSQAVDAAALAGARSLSREATLPLQTARAQDTSLRFFNANFPNKFWGCTVVAPVPLSDIAVTEDVNFMTRFVTINARVTAPLYFLRLLGVTTTTLSASGQAARREVNIMLVIDRSSSMNASGAIAPTVAAATSFVNEFAPGRDYLGMVVFGGDYYLYTPRQDFGLTSADPLVTEIKKIASSGNTNTATALWVAYNALAGLNQPGALNVILFFTDGLPNGITADMIHTIIPTATPTFVDYRTNPSDTTNRCGPAQVNGVAPAGLMVGWLSQTNGFSSAPGSVGGLYTTVTSTVNDPNDGSQGHVISVSGSLGNACGFTNDHDNLHNDFNQFPAYDIYGTPTWDDPNKPNYYTAAMNPMILQDLKDAINVPLKLGRASKNAADFVAQRWRHGDVNGIVPLVYGISLTQPNAGSEAPDPMFMLRVTNTHFGLDNSDNPITNGIYDPNSPKGTYISTKQQDQLQGAFLQIASQILHLSK